MNDPSEVSEGLPRYDAFASYATDPDRDLVRDVEDFIESLHQDPLMQEAFKVPLELCVDGRDFRIPKSINASDRCDDNLIRTVVCAYQAASRCLVVFSGSHSLTHPWINNEIVWWIERFGSANVYFALTHGDLRKDEHGRPILGEVMPNALALQGGGANLFWFDLRGFYLKRRWTVSSRSRLHRELRNESSQWSSVRDYGEERFRLAAHILSEKISQPLIADDLIPSWRAAIRNRRRKFRNRVLGSVVCVLLTALAAWMLQYRNAQAERTVALVGEVQAAIDDQRYEAAMQYGLRGLPVRGQVPWALPWSHPVIRRLEAKVAGAAQLSSMTARLQESRAEDRANFTYAAFSPDGTKIVTAAENGRTSIWDVSTKRRIVECKKEKVIPGKYWQQFESLDWIPSSQFSPDGSQIVSANHDGVAWIWTPEGDTCRGRALLPSHDGPVRGAAFSHNPAGKYVITASDDGTTRLWDALSANPLLEDHPRQWNHGKLTSVDFSPNELTIAISSHQGYVAIAGAMTNDEPLVLQESGAPVWSVKFDSAGKRIVTASDDGRVAIFDTISGKMISWLPKQTHSINSAAFSPDGQRLVTASADKTVRIWDITDPYSIRALFVFKGHSQKASVRHAEFGPDGNSIVSASTDRSIRIWDASTNAKPTIMRAHDKSVRSIEISGDGKRFVTVGDDGTAKVWNLGLGRAISEEASVMWSEGGGIVSARFGRTNDHVVIGLREGLPRVWNIESHSLVAPAREQPGTPPTSVSKNTVGAAARSFSSGELFVIPSDKEKGVQIWDVQTNSHWQLRAPQLQIRKGELSRDQTRLVLISTTGQAQLWNVNTGKQLFHLDDSGGTSAYFSADGSKVVTASLDRIARVWDAFTGAQTYQLRGHGGDIYGARFSADGTRIVTASGDHTVRIWAVDTGTEMVRFSVDGDALDATFTKDGKTIIVALDDGNIQLFDVRWTVQRGAELVRQICEKKLPNCEGPIPDDGIEALFEGYTERLRSPCC